MDPASVASGVSSTDCVSSTEATASATERSWRMKLVALTTYPFLPSRGRVCVVTSMSSRFMYSMRFDTDRGVMP